VNIVLEISRLSKTFGGLTAISDLDCSLNEGEVLGLIGPNGAGKSTLFNLIGGVYRPTRGRIIFKGKDITGNRSDKVAARAIIRMFQHTVLFSTYTVFQNVLVATHVQCRPAFFPTLFNSSGYRKRERDARARAAELLEFVGLQGFGEELAPNLSHGHQRSLGLAIALAANPSLLLLDEPMSGMNQEETESMMALIKKISDSGVTVLLVEHNMRAVMGVCDRVLVLNFGRKITEGAPVEVSQDERVIQAYLGA